MIDMNLTFCYDEKGNICEMLSEDMILEEKEISQAVIGRLPRYFRYLGELSEQFRRLRTAGVRL